MTRIEIRIGSLVVHGAQGFAGDAFSTALSAEIERRVGTGTGGSELADRFRADAPRAPAAPATIPARGDSFEAATAARVAGRLLP